MKFIKIFSFLLIFTSFSAMAQDKEVKTVTFEVKGVCGMCEERIENALDVKGVKSAEWEQSTHKVTVVYRTDKISEDDMHKLLNEVGHDTERSRATDEQYATVHECCKYREHEDHP